MRARSSRPEDVERVRRQLEQWRRRRDRGRRIPESLWTAVVKVARRHGVSRISQALRLDYYSIKRRLESTPGPQPVREEPRGGFVELPLRAVPATPACVLEIEDGRGARLRLELQGLGAGELAGVIRSAWSEQR